MQERLQIQEEEIFHIAQVHNYGITNQIVTAPKRKFKNGDWVKITKLKISEEDKAE